MKRHWSFIGLLAILAAGTYIAYEASQLYIYRAAFAGSYKYNLLFTNYAWLVPMAVFLGVFVGASSKEKKAELVDGKILRHDENAFMVHWSHALSTLALLGTGVYLGFLFIPRLVLTPQQAGFALNLHFVGVLIFLFSVTHHVTNVLVSGKLKEHMPEAGDMHDAIAHYAAKFGIGQKPREGKFLASERLSYPLWVVSVGLVILSGFIKVAAHVWNIPAGVMGATTFLHDVGALLVGLNLVAHIIMSSVMPWSWPLLRSMITGYVSADYAKHHHVKWYEEVTGTSVPDEPAKKSKQKGVKVNG